MKIAFISTRGIPNNYGGFEQFAEYISVGLAARGHEVVVYSPHFHPYKKDTYKSAYFGASSGGRTLDLRIKSPLLYQLS